MDKKIDLNISACSIPALRQKLTCSDLTKLFAIWGFRRKWEKCYAKKLHFLKPLSGSCNFPHPKFSLDTGRGAAILDTDLS